MEEYDVLKLYHVSKHCVMQQINSYTGLTHAAAHSVTYIADATEGAAFW